MLSTLNFMDLGLLILRWLHLFFGVIWIGLLYYFNFVQGPFFNETDAATKSNATQKLVPRALWWFRWAAFWTFATGFTYLMASGHQNAGAGLASAYWVNILTGSLLGTLMFLNVWGIIWRNQKVVIANAVQTASGGAANPNAAAAGARALVASRTNTMFSIPMLFFMLSARHLPYGVTETSNLTLYWILIFVLIGALEINAIKGKLGPLTTIKGVITCGFVLTATLGAIIALTI